MPGELSTLGANQALDWTTGRNAAYTATSGAAGRTTYLGLWTAALTDASTLATAGELAVAGYARQSVAWTAPTGDPSKTQNTSVITFGPFTADPANVTYCGLGSASSGTSGDFLMWWQLDVAKDAAINESIQFAAGALYMTLD